MAMAITISAAQFSQITGEELQVKFLADSEENSLGYCDGWLRGMDLNQLPSGYENVLN
jgi:hypothetical protein